MLLLTRECHMLIQMFELNTKLWLTNGLLFINFDSGGNNKLLRLFIGLLISLVALTAQLVLRPFRKKTDDAIASVIRSAPPLSAASPKPFYRQAPPPPPSPLPPPPG